jgi:Avidin family
MSTKDPLSGVWYSGVGSKLEVEVEGTKLIGFFSSTEEGKDRFPLHGSVDPDPRLVNRALSFSVAWISSDTSPEYRSVTSYTGQYHSTPQGEIINTIFLLADETSPKKQYASTFVGYDNFRRSKPSEAEIKTESSIRRHPSSLLAE